MTSNPNDSFTLSSRHLLGIEGLSAAEITGLLDLAEEFVTLNRQVEKKRATLRGRTQINLFFEASTRTQSSFELAGKRLGADVMNMSIDLVRVRDRLAALDRSGKRCALGPLRDALLCFEAARFAW